MSLKEKDISIIIPCFNARAEHLQEAVNSVTAYNGKFIYEIVITDDGSTSVETIALLNEYERQNITVIRQENKGPSAARNNAVYHSTGHYLLCLDSDNAIRPEYIDEGIAALASNPKAAVAYGNANFIGEISRSFFAGKFDIEKLLTENYIDMCAVIKKEAWENVGGLDENLIRHEDWEFWIRLFKAGWEFVYLDKALFDYRIRTGSLMSQTSPHNFEEIIAYLYKKHWNVVFTSYQKLYGTKIIYMNDKKRPFHSFIKYLLKK